MNAATKQVNIMNLQVGNVVRFHCARFEITSVKVMPETDQQLIANGTPEYMVANGKWIDGHEEGGYFGRSKDWTFQGNSNVAHTVEI